MVLRRRTKPQLTHCGFVRRRKTTSHAAAVYVGTLAKRLQSESRFRERNPLCSLSTERRVLCRVLRAPGGPREYVKDDTFETLKNDLPSAAVAPVRAPTARLVREWCLRGPQCT